MVAANGNHDELLRRLDRARRAGTPLVAINTPDQPATATAIAKWLSEQEPADDPIFTWDFVRGGQAANTAAAKDGGVLGNSEENPIAVLRQAIAMPHRAMLLYYNAQRFVQDAGVCQGLMNLRDEFKASDRMVILLGTGINLPGEIASDVIVLSEPLPDDARLLHIVSAQVNNAGEQFTKKPTPDMMKRAATALRGTSAFGAEQLSAMSLRADGIDIETLSIQAKALIEQTPGLTFERGKETFKDIGGLDFIKEFGTRMFKGPKAPAVVVRVEELEKAMAGARGDLSGTSGDALQVLLSELEDNNWTGLLAYGVPGAGKSLFAKALANTFQAKAIRFDINACKGSLVGQSERQIRQAMQVIRTIGGDRVFFIGSCNRLESIPPELQRRFRAGTWFFDLPEAAERQAIWDINRKRFSIPPEEKQEDEVDLSGADIRNICENAYVLQSSLTEARKYVVPIKQQSKGEIEASRALAAGRFTDAARGGVYDRSRQAKASERKVKVSA
jgi:hypothetical protein